MRTQDNVLLTGGVLALFALFTTGACGSSDLLVGDDARDAVDGATSDASVLPEASPPGPPLDAAKDAVVDAPIDASCPDLVPPGPAFCGGGPFAPTYNAKGCINGFACAPVTCSDAGGGCVGLAPGSCATNHWGDATKYSCGGGLGVGCCLP